MKNFFNKFYTDKLVKDTCKTDDNTNVVYRIDCNECEATYVGQTSCRSDIRIKEHRKR